MKHALILALLLVAGCKMETTETTEYQRYIAEYQRDSTRVALEMASERAAAHADSVMAWNPARVDTVLIGPSYAAAKVAAVMAANDITLPQVAAWLNTYNMDVVNRGAWMRPHWRPASGQVTYYMFRPEIAVADTTVEFMVRGHIPGAWPATVQGVLLLQNGSALRGPVSEIGWSDNGSGAGALPGMIQ